MPTRQENMTAAQSLIWALEGLDVKPPKVLQNIVNGFDILGPIQAATVDPAATILAAAVDGKLTATSLDELLASAAAESTTHAYRQDFRLRAERKFAQRFHQALIDGAADEVLDAIRPKCDAIAEELTEARNAVDIHSTPERLLNVTATAAEQDAWRRLPNLVKQIEQITAIAAVFGHQAKLAVVDDLNAHDSLLQLGWLDDRALMCTTGNVVTASNTFRQPNPHWHTSPWLRLTLKLATIAEAQETYREVAESDFNARVSHFAGDGALTDNGFVPRTFVNPHAKPEMAEAES